MGRKNFQKDGYVYIEERERERERETEREYHLPVGVYLSTFIYINQ